MKNLTFFLILALMVGCVEDSAMFVDDQPRDAAQSRAADPRRDGNNNRRQVQDSESEPEVPDEGVEEPETSAPDVSTEPDAEVLEPDMAPTPEQNDDHAQDNDGNPPREHLLVVEVGREAEQSAITFSWGYCSDVSDPRACHDWNENASRVLWDTAVRQSVLVLETGFVRFNASFYNDGDRDVQGNRIVGQPNGWLAERQPNNSCALTGMVTVWIDGSLVRPGVSVVPFQNGCSAALNVSELVRLVRRR